jgi:hypothetical protein
MEWKTVVNGGAGKEKVWSERGLTLERHQRVAKEISVMNYGLWSYLGENRLLVDRTDGSTKDYGLHRSV